MNEGAHSRSAVRALQLFRWLGRPGGPPLAAAPLQVRRRVRPSTAPGDDERTARRRRWRSRCDRAAQRQRQKFRSFRNGCRVFARHRDGRDPAEPHCSSSSCLSVEPASHRTLRIIACCSLRPPRYASQPTQLTVDCGRNTQRIVSYRDILLCGRSRSGRSFFRPRSGSPAGGLVRTWVRHSSPVPGSGYMRAMLNGGLTPTGARHTGQPFGRTENLRDRQIGRNFPPPAAETAAFGQQVQKTIKLDRPCPVLVASF
jgi:hypothetical protein